MKLVATCLLTLLLSGMLLAQTGTAAQDKSASQANPAGMTAAQLQALQHALAAQQQQIDRQERELEALRRQLAGQGTPQVSDAALHTSRSLSTARAVVGDAVPQEGEKPKESPLSFRIGAAEFTPGGFADFESIFRTTNTGSVSGTSFGTIPFSNTIQGHLTEFRATGQYSRLTLKTHARFGQNDMIGYLEVDFNGNDPANVFVTSNSHTDRLRLYWLDLKRGKWEFLGGQTWGLFTPNRTGLSPWPADIAVTYADDGNHQVGLNWTRAAEFRVTYHFNENWAWGTAIENPQQFVGAGEVLFPFAFNAALSTQFDPGNNPGTPNVAPDLVTKLAYDTSPGGKHFHVELGGLLTTVKVTAVPVGGTTFESRSSVGGGVESALNFELLKSSDGRYLRFIANGMWGNGVGRYIIGLGPQAVVAPIQTGPTTFDLDTSLVHAGNALGGFEFVPTPKSQFGVYYGGAYFQQNFFPDVTSPLLVKPFIGFGGPNSPNSANRALQQATLDWTQTLWKDSQYGSLLLITQYSYLTRSPWFVAAGAPKNAHLSMGYASLRYVLP